MASLGGASPSLLSLERNSQPVRSPRLAKICLKGASIRFVTGMLVLKVICAALSSSTSEAMNSQNSRLQSASSGSLLLKPLR